MDVRIEVEVGQVRGGWLARAPKLKLSRAGKSEAQALVALKQSVVAYCEALRRDGTLGAALGRSGVSVDGDPDSYCEAVLVT